MSHPASVTAGAELPDSVASDSASRAPCGGPRGTGVGADSPGLPAWLEEDEWNACFFLGHQAFYRDGVECRVCEQVCVGIRQLGASGYRFARLRCRPDGAWGPAAGASPPARDRDACAQLADQTFDHQGRAQRALDWLTRNAPGLERSWLEGQVELFQRLHTP